MGAPKTGHRGVGARANVIKEVDMERHVAKKDVAHVVLRDFEQLHFRFCRKPGTVSLTKAEKSFRLEHHGRGTEFTEDVAAVVATLLAAYGSAERANKRFARIAFFHNGCPARHGEELKMHALIDTDVVVEREALEEGRFAETIDELLFHDQGSVSFCMPSVIQTLYFPCPSAKMK